LCSIWWLYYQGEQFKKKNCLNCKTKTKYRCKSKKLAGKSKLIHTTKTIANPKTFSSKKPSKPYINCHVKEKLELLLFEVEKTVYDLISSLVIEKTLVNFSQN
jgi:hypothetical protein